VTLADGRRLAYDDVGDPKGAPVLYLHGCPDCRLTRHPDDGVAHTRGIRLLSVDRPGYGASDPPAEPTLESVGRDLSQLLDALALDRCAVLAWSSGAMVALALAAERPDAISHLTLVAGTLPNPGPCTDDDLALIVELLVPADLTRDLAIENIRENKSAAYLRDLESVPGLAERLADGFLAAVAHGTTGAVFDIRAVASPLSLDLSTIETPVSLFYAERDDVVPVSTGSFLSKALPNATLEVVPNASHLLLMTHWSTLLDSLGRPSLEELSCR
jgi:pimeloyl-ACP methyl ester carboxylesterase